MILTMATFITEESLNFDLVEGLDLNKSLNEFVSCVIENGLGQFWPQPESDFYCRCCNYAEFATQNQWQKHLQSPEHKMLQKSYENSFCLACQVHTLNEYGMKWHCLTDSHQKLSILLTATQAFANCYWKRNRVQIWTMIEAGATRPSRFAFSKKHSERRTCLTKNCLEDENINKDNTGTIKFMSESYSFSEGECSDANVPPVIQEENQNLILLKQLQYGKIEHKENSEDLFKEDNLTTFASCLMCERRFQQQSWKTLYYHRTSKEHLDNIVLFLSDEKYRKKVEEAVEKFTPTDISEFLLEIIYDKEPYMMEKECFICKNESVDDWNEHLKEIKHQNRVNIYTNYTQDEKPSVLMPENTRSIQDFEEDDLVKVNGCLLCKTKFLKPCLKSVYLHRKKKEHLEKLVELGNEPRKKFYDTHSEVHTFELDIISDSEPFVDRDGCKRCNVKLENGHKFEAHMNSLKHLKSLSKIDKKDHKCFLCNRIIHVMDLHSHLSSKRHIVYMDSIGVNPNYHERMEQLMKLSRTEAVMTRKRKVKKEKISMEVIGKKRKKKKIPEQMLELRNCKPTVSCSSITLPAPNATTTNATTTNVRPLMEAHFVSEKSVPTIPQRDRLPLSSKSIPHSTHPNLFLTTQQKTVPQTSQPKYNYATQPKYLLQTILPLPNSKFHSILPLPQQPILPPPNNFSLHTTPQTQLIPTLNSSRPPPINQPCTTGRTQNPDFFTNQMPPGGNDSYFEFGT